MNILMSGADGLVGSALVPALIAQGHAVRRLARERKHPSDALWNPPQIGVPAEALETTDAVIHLSGEPISSGRWTPAKKKAILRSRVDSTRAITQALLTRPKPPRLLICASAVGFYGSRGDEILSEQSAGGQGFLAEVCRQWEAEAQPAIAHGVRVFSLRFGMILSTQGGALKTMLPPFRLGVGGKLGNGRQYMSWIAIDDVVGSILHVITSSLPSGPVNVVAPEFITNAQFTEALGRVLRRPTLFSLPAFAARLALGEMADELLLASMRVQPAVLTTNGYRFRYPTIESALRYLLTS